MPDTVNDAVAYGVRVISAEVAPGADYWRVVRVHHLIPQENDQRHHIFLDVLDVAGARVTGARVRVDWDGGGRDLVIDKPPSEPGANEPMWKWEICSVQALDLPSDLVENLHTAHPDEPPGNTLFHHSFLVVFQRALFQRAQAEVAPAPAQSAVAGKVPGGAGHTLVLIDGDGHEAEAQVNDDETYRFEGLAAGRFTITDAEDHRTSYGPIEVDGVHNVQADFPPAHAIPWLMAAYVLFGPPDEPATQVYLLLLADHLAARRLSFGFSLKDATRAGQVTLVGQHAEATKATLEAAGARVEQLPLDPGALLKALDQLP
jgi:hypothetical protein